jgi:hypothetical protein
MDPAKLIIEARARIIWGEEVSSVREFMVSNGMSETDADVKIQEFNLERIREIRGIGLKNTVIGLALILGAGIVIYLFFNYGHSHHGTSSSYGRIIGFPVVAAFYGFWKLMKGIIYLVRPQSEHESIPDIED